MCSAASQHSHASVQSKASLARSYAQRETASLAGDMSTWIAKRANRSVGCCTWS